MLKIRKTQGDSCTVISLSGRIEGQHLAALQQLLDAEAVSSGVVFDLQEVTLVDREAVRFLAGCEAREIQLSNCPAYIREWLDTGKGSKP